MLTRTLIRSAFCLALVAFASSGCKTTQPAMSPTSPFTTKRTPYHGWTDAIVLGNGQVEAVIVPSVGRVMQFRFAGESDGPLWENPLFHGKATDPESKDWGNFGGDKTWPAPQDEWGKVTPRSWPPPVAFDSMPVEASIANGIVTLTSPIDPHYGIRTVRRIQLAADRPVMTISTRYEKIKGDPKRVAIWTITQLKDPTVVCMPIPPKTTYTEGYNLQSQEAVPSLNRGNGFLMLTRNAQKPYKIGNDSSTLVWIGEKTALRIDTTRIPNVEYPDKGSSAEVYTNPDPLPYVELELLGPLHDLKNGDTTESANTYTLLRRAEITTDAEARKILEAK